MIKEEWRPIFGYEGLYEVSNLGRVKSLNYNRTGKEKILKPIRLKNGYLQVCLTINGKQKMHYVHHLVAQSFYGGCQECFQIDHINFQRDDNRVENLRYLPEKENIRRKSNPEYNKKKVSMIDLCSSSIISEFLSITDAHNRTGINKGNICSCANGKRKSAGGVGWVFG